MNTWEDSRITDRVNQINKSKIVLAGLWTSVCIVGPALSAIDQGFEVYVVADACGDVSDESHDRAIERMVLLGARLMTSLQYLLELQRDWARSGTYDETVRTSIQPRRFRCNKTHLAKSPICWSAAIGVPLSRRRP